MKKLPFLALSLTMLLAACSGAGDNPSSSSPIPSSEESSESSSSTESSSEESTSTPSSESSTSSEVPSSSSSESTSSSESSETSSSTESTSSSESSSESTSSSESSSSTESSSETTSSTEPVDPTFTLAYEDAGGHMEVAFYNENGIKITEAGEYDWVYVKVTGPEDGSYGLLSIGVRYWAESATDYRTEDITENYTDQWNDDRYSWQIPNITDNSTITFIITERDMTKFRDYAFVGDYLGVDVSNSSAKNISSFSSNLAFTINMGGDVVFADTSVDKSVTITSATSTSGRGTFYTTGYVTVDYDDNLIFYADYMEKSLSSSQFWYFGVKKQNTDDADSLYTVDCQAFAVEGVRYISMRAFRDGVPYVSAFIDGSTTTPTIHFGATFEMVAGDNLTDDTSIYEVYDGETLLHTVGYKLTGGYNNRIFLSEPYGNFAVGEKTLFLDGNGNATYDGLNWLYTLGDDGVTVTLVSGLRTIIGTLDLTTRTFTITSDETREDTGPAFMGHAYRGSFVDGWGDDTYYLYLVFDETDYTVSSSAGFSASQTLGGVYLANTDIAYTYDSATSTITIENFTNYTESKTMTMVYNSATDQITINNDFSGYYTTAGCVLSLVS